MSEWYKTSRDAALLDGIARSVCDDRFVFATRWEACFISWEMKCKLVPLDYPKHAVTVDMLAISSCYEPDAAIETIRAAMTDAVQAALDEAVDRIVPIADILTNRP